jgi:cell division protein FtsI (penicillin-binding protein 3)
VKIQQKRITYIYWFFILFFLILAARISYLQIFRRAFFQRLATKQYYRLIPIEGRRGTIYDSQDRIMATGITSYSVFADPMRIEDSELVASELAAILDLDKEFIKERLVRKKRFIWLKRQITWDEKENIQALGYKGIEVMRDKKRFYPQGNLASTVLGIVDIDNKGLEGVELHYDKLLAGKTAKVRVLQDSAAREVLLSPQTVDAQEGVDLVLTIDTQIQYWVEQFLTDIVKRYRAKQASAIVMDPYTGDILALVNVPNFDPNNIDKESLKYVKNRAVTDMFEPGSIYKIVTLTAAVETGLFDDNEIIFCENGKWKIPGSTLHDWKPYGDLTFVEVFKKSSNIGVAKVAQELGKTTLYLYMNLLGFGELTGVDLPGEVPGSLKHADKWSRTSEYIVPIGQEVGVTMVQLARGVSAVVNGGYLVKPRIVKAIRGPGLDRVINVERKRVISKEAAEHARDILVQVVEDGTGKLARVKGVTVGGKTGTAQKFDPKLGRYSPTKYRASFMGFVVDFPKTLVIGITVDEPRGSHFGGVVAAPVFQKIVEKVAPYLGGVKKAKTNEDKGPIFQDQTTSDSP